MALSPSAKASVIIYSWRMADPSFAIPPGTTDLLTIDVENGTYGLLVNTYSEIPAKIEDYYNMARRYSQTHGYFNPPAKFKNVISILSKPLLRRRKA